MGRAPCCSGEHAGLKKGPWTHEEDEKLRSFLLRHPNTSWRLVPQKAGLIRCGKSCRLRWMNYLRPDIRRGNFTEGEENLIIQLHGAVGNKWSVIAAQLPGRTDNEIKNLWNTRLRKILVLKGINPITHQPLCNPLLSDYVKQWVKSIESMLIAGLVTQPPITSMSTDTNTSNGSFSSNSSFDSHSLPSLISLPSDPLVSYEGIDQSPFLNFSSGPSTIGNSSWVDDSTIGNSSWVDDNSHGGETYSDSPMLGENIFLTSNFSYLADGYEVNRGKTFADGEMNALGSPAPISLEEGLKYWN